MGDQKPGDVLLENFPRQVPQVGAVPGGHSPKASNQDDSTKSAGNARPQQTYGNPLRRYICHALLQSKKKKKILTRDTGSTGQPSQPEQHPHFHDLDPTPQPNIDPWRFNPSLLDPNSFAFSGFAHGGS
jgi:hypothetical protein